MRMKSSSKPRTSGRSKSRIHKSGNTGSQPKARGKGPGQGHEGYMKGGGNFPR